MREANIDIAGKCSVVGTERVIIIRGIWMETGPGKPMSSGAEGIRGAVAPV